MKNLSIKNYIYISFLSLGGDSMQFIAHIRSRDHFYQSVEEHLENVAYLGRRYGEPIGFGAHAELAGLLHDMGKFTIHFSEYIENTVIYKEVSHKKIDHSTAGAKYLYELFYDGSDLQKLVIEIVGMAILSHHSGLQNFSQLDLQESDYIRRVLKKDLPYYNEVKSNFEKNKQFTQRVKQLVDEACQELQGFLQKIRGLGHANLYVSYLQKLIFSILLDADRTDARRFEEDDASSLESTYSFQHAYDTLMKSVRQFEKSKKPIDLLRSKMSRSCDMKAEEPSGIYTLSVPTGGGKTFASLRYALKHAYLHDKKRIIYVVPYTTILEQNAEAVRKIINDDEAVLEHHANVVDARDQGEDYYDDPLHKKMQLARDNWDYPIIFTTAVQFLDAFFQKGTRKTRRLHHLTNAVIIFDEVQSVPYRHFALFNTAVNFLHYVGNSSILLCTATQPAVDHMEYPMRLTEPVEIVEQLDKVAHAFERVSIHLEVKKTGWSASQLAERVREEMRHKQSTLIILNTKTAVRKLYAELQDYDEGLVYHLSTSMCPAHRDHVLTEIRHKLGKEPVICISTQLIEAGVDISFEAVFRSLAGLDSIAQAAGRCNRNAEAERGDVYIFKSSDETLKFLPEIRIGAEVMENFILPNEEFIENLLHPKVIERYFTYFHRQAEREITKNPQGLDLPLIDLINGKFQMDVHTISRSSFKTLETYFEAIHSPTTSVLVPYDETAKNMIALLNEELTLDEFNTYIKRAQRYAVNLFDYELAMLEKENLIYPLLKEGIIAVREEGYSNQYGISFLGEGEKADLFF